MFGPACRARTKRSRRATRGAAHLDDAECRERSDDGPRGIDLPPTNCEVRRIGTTVVVVLVQLAKCDEVDRQRVSRGVAFCEVAIPVLVTAPVHDSSVDRTHQVVRGDEERKRDREGNARRRDHGHEKEIRKRVERAESDASKPRVRDSIERGPRREVCRKAGLELDRVVNQPGVTLLRVPHHRQEVWKAHWTVRVTIRVAERVVLAMQDRVRVRNQVRRALRDPRREVEEPLPALTHREVTMRAVAMQEERLHEDRGPPVEDEEREENGARDEGGHGPNIQPFSSVGRVGIVTIPSWAEGVAQETRRNSRVCV